MGSPSWVGEEVQEDEAITMYFLSPNNSRDWRRASRFSLVITKMSFETLQPRQ